MIDRRFVGGPLDGQTMPVRSDVGVVELAAHPGMAYHRTHGEADCDLDFWEPMTAITAPEKVVFEWHEASWVSPWVKWFRAAIAELIEGADGPAGE